MAYTLPNVAHASGDPAAAIGDQPFHDDSHFLEKGRSDGALTARSLDYQAEVARCTRRGERGDLGLSDYGKSLYTSIPIACVMPA